MSIGYKGDFTMAKKVLMISCSLRSHSNSEALADSFMEGARAAGNKVEKITLKDKSIAFCKGCLACQSLHHCVIADDAVEIAEKMRQADVIVFATPIYYYEMSGQLKTLLDRANSLYASDYAFRDIYFLSSAADDAKGTDERAIHGLEGWIACYEKCRLAGTVFAGGVDGAGAIQGHPALEKAFAMGESIQ
jgi:multimeric flavodoxin WrbA